MIHSNTTNSLWRSNTSEKGSDFRSTQYGQGRDGYFMDNTASQSNYGDGCFGNIFKYSCTQKDKPSYFIGRMKYHSDGQGRDSYILQNRYAFKNDDNMQTRFQSSLRQYESPFTKSRIRLVTGQDIAREKQQREHSTQLSTPKYIDSKMPASRTQKSFWNRTKSSLNSLELQKTSNSNSMVNSPRERESRNDVLTADSTPPPFSPQFQRSFFEQSMKYRSAAMEQNFFKSDTVKTPKMSIHQQQTEKPQQQQQNLEGIFPPLKQTTPAHSRFKSHA